MSDSLETYLPNEIVFHILEFASVEVLRNVASVSRRFREISNHDILWKDFFLLRGVYAVNRANEISRRSVNSLFFSRSREEVIESLRERVEKIKDRDKNYRDGYVGFHELSFKLKQKIIHSKKTCENVSTKTCNKLSRICYWILPPMITINATLFISFISIALSWGSEYFRWVFYLFSFICASFSLISCVLFLLFIVIQLICFKWKAISFEYSRIHPDFDAWERKSSNKTETVNSALFYSGKYEQYKFLSGIVVIIGLLPIGTFSVCCSIKGVFVNLPWIVSFIPLFCILVLFIVLFLISFFFPLAVLNSDKLKFRVKHIIIDELEKLPVFTSIIGTMLLTLFFVVIQVVVYCLYLDGVLGNNVHVLVLLIPTFVLSTALLISFIVVIIISIISCTPQCESIDLKAWEFTDGLTTKILGKLFCCSNDYQRSFSDYCVHSGCPSSQMLISIACCPFILSFVLVSLFANFGIDPFFGFIPVILVGVFSICSFQIGVLKICLRKSLNVFPIEYVEKSKDKQKRRLEEDVDYRFRNFKNYIGGDDSNFFDELNPFDWS